MEASGVRKPVGLPRELPTPQGPGQAYTAEELTEWANGGLQARDFERGKRMYAAARCIVCHRYGGEGGATGPDLTQVAGRFSAQDLIDAMVHPSRVISDQYKSMMIQARDGTVISGRVTLLAEATPEILRRQAKEQRWDPQAHPRTVPPAGWIALADFLGKIGKI